MDDKFTLNIEKVRRDKKLLKIAKLVLVIIILAILFSYMIIGFIYNSGNFTITLDDKLYYERGLVIYDDPNYKTYRAELLAETIGAFDNTTELMIERTLTESEGGSHNGDNYIAYTFYIENTGTLATDYYSEIVIEDVIKNVDEAVRIKVIKNDESITYAKASSSGAPEEGTTAFISEKTIAFDHQEDFAPGAINKYTIIIWIEGKDPETTNNIIDGEINLKMQFNSEIVEN